MAKGRSAGANRCVVLIALPADRSRSDETIFFPLVSAGVEHATGLDGNEPACGDDLKADRIRIIATDEKLAHICTPDGDNTWCPIPHETLVSEVEGALNRANMRIVTEAHGMSGDGARYFGLLQVANGDEQGDYSYVLGLRNSHDKRFPAGLVVGSAVFVCDNLAFSGEIKIARKHTRFIMRDLPGLVSGAVGQLGDRWHEQAERINAYRGHELTDVQAHDLVIRALDNRAITVTQVPAILQEWRTPRHPEFSADGKSAWRLFNAVTEAAKGSGLWALPQRTQALHGLLDGEVGLFSQS